MTDACWLLVIQGEYVPNTLFVWNGYGTGMKRVWNGHPAQHHVLRFAFDGLERRGLERNSGI